MAGYDPWLTALRAEARKAVGDNQRAMTAPGSCAVQARQPEQQWWNLPAKYDAARRIKGEILAAYPGHDDAGDAMRHAELSRRMAVEIDPLTSAIAGYAHEIDNSIPGLPPSWQIGSLGRHAQENWHGQRWPERRMDLHNNAEGRRASRQGRPVNSAVLQIRPAQPAQAVAPYGEF